MNWDTWLAELSWTPVPEADFESLPREEKLRRIRHSSAHVMASAIQALHPDAVFATGPATGHGFFYDIRTTKPITQDELAKIQEQIEKITSRKTPFERTEVDREKAIEYFKAKGQDLKVEIIGKIKSPTVSLYRHYQFVDLCAGPHVPTTRFCRYSKVLSHAAAHWKKDEKIPSLTRVYGTAWTSTEELKEYDLLLEETKTRDHRVLGPKLELFSFHEWAASAFWHPHGLFVRQTLMSLWRDTIYNKGYIEIQNPVLYRKELFETSGHWQHYQDDMFIIRDKEGEPQFALKPMNCPDTMLYFKTKTRSYRDLPLRIAEGQLLHRNEAAGAVHGLMRTRNFTQDDAHLFVAPEHIQGEVHMLLEMVASTYKLFDIQYTFKLSTRPKEFLGTIETWDQAETALKNALDAAKVNYTINEGDGAFYGPKIDITINDSLGRQWQCATIQLDMQLPERFDLSYSAQDGSLKRPIVIHRAVFGSFERFIAILIEHLGGAFPTWLAPVQIAVLPIAERHLEYANSVVEKLKTAGLRVSLESDGSINYRIRNSETLKVPFMLVMGDKEAQAGTVAVRSYSTKAQSVVPLDDFIKDVQERVRSRTLDVQIRKFNALFAETKSTENEDY